MHWILSRTSALCGSIGLALSCAAGCSEPLAAPVPAAHAEDAAPERGGTLHLATIGDIRSLDPSTSDQLSAQADELLYAGLVDADTKSNVIPDVATRWELSPDGLVYTFFLRENVRFHDGEELTAEDVKRSMERALHPATPNPLASFYDDVVGFEEYTTQKAPHLAGIEIAGRYVVAFRLKKPDATFLARMTLMPARPVCKSAGDRYVDTWAPCGAGPFKVLPGGWERGRSLTVVRHEGFFRPGLPYLDAVNFSYGMNQLSQRFKFESGELDVLREMVQADSLRFKSDPRWQGLHAMEPATMLLGENMNTEMAPFDNVEVRRAVSCAIDREQYHALRETNVSAHTHAVPADVPGYNPNVPGQKFDRAEALEHMRKAGYPYDPATGRGGYEPHIEYIAYRPGFSEYTAQVLQQNLAKIGIRIDIKIVNFATHLSLTHRRHRVPFSYQGWSQDYPDAVDFYESLFTSKQINEDDSTNSSFYKNPVLDELVERAHHELDPAARQGLFDRAEAIVRDDAPWAFAYCYRFFNVHQPYVRNYRVHPLWVFDARETWLDRAKSLLATGTFPGFRAPRGPLQKDMGARRLGLGSGHDTATGRVVR